MRNYMKFILLGIFLLPNFAIAAVDSDDRKVSELSIDELNKLFV